MTDALARAVPRPKARPRQQYAALPWRPAEASLEILLISSRETGRWVIPKGWPMKGKTPAAAAAVEAFEEAGVVGEIAKDPVGSYLYVKFRRTGRGQPCKVRVFPLRVLADSEDWPEKGQRTLQWLPWPDAAGAVQERQLARLIRKFAKRTTKAAKGKGEANPSPLAGEGGRQAG